LVGLGTATFAAAPKSIAVATSAKVGVTSVRADGFIPFSFDSAKNRVLIEVPVLDADILYYVTAATGGITSPQPPAAVRWSSQVGPKTASPRWGVGPRSRFPAAPGAPLGQ
jgi:hypothetical protein